MNRHYTSILVKIAGGVAFVKLNNPTKFSAVSLDSKRELADFFKRAATDPRIKVVLITGKDNVFYVGSDLLVRERAAISGGGNKAYSAKRERVDLIKIINDFEKPVIAAVNGFAIGAGIELVKASDLVLASDKAQFCDISGNDNSPLTDRDPMFDMGGTRVRYKRIISRNLDATQAIRAGLVNIVTPHEDLMKEAERLANSVAKGNTFILDHKRRVNDKYAMSATRPAS